MQWKSKVASLVQKLELTEAHIEEWEQKYADIEKEREELCLKMLKKKKDLQKMKS